MTVSRYTKNHMVREDLTSSITPLNKVHDDVRAPHGPFKVAPWLPIAFSKQDLVPGKTHFVIGSGKVVAQDANGDIVPAGLRAALVDLYGSSTTVLQYGANDFAMKVEDLVTGAEVASSSVAYTAEQVAEALLARGFVSVDSTTAGAGTPDSVFAATGQTDADTMVREIIEKFISIPVGIMAYDAFVFTGRHESGDAKFTNMNMQYHVQFLTEMQMRVAHRTTQSETADAFDVSDVTAVAAVTDAGDFIEPGEIWLETALDDVARYAAAVDGRSVVALGLAHRPIAANTDRTPLTCDVDGVLTRSRASIELISKEGDFYLDADMGVLFIHSDTYATIVGADTDPTFGFNFYTVTGATGANSDRFVFFEGEGTPGDEISYDRHSNFVVMGSAQDALGTNNLRCLGRLHKIVKEPFTMLDSVKTAWAGSQYSATSKAVGSASGGYGKLITLPSIDSDLVADELVYINFVAR